MAQMSQLETNLSRVFYLGAALTGLFAGEMVFAPGAALRNHFGIEHPTAREQEIAKVSEPYCKGPSIVGIGREELNKVNNVWSDDAPPKEIKNFYTFSLVHARICSSIRT